MTRSCAYPCSKFPVDRHIIVLILDQLGYFFDMQEQLHEKEQAIRDLERRMEEKDRELISIKRDNEAVCRDFGFIVLVVQDAFWR